MGILSTREGRKSAKGISNFLKGQHTNSHWQPLTMVSGVGRAEQTSVMYRKTGVSGFGEKSEGTATKKPVLSFSPMPQIPSFWVAHSLFYDIFWGKAIDPFSGILVTPPFRAQTLLRSQLPKQGCIILDRLRGYK